MKAQNLFTIQTVNSEQTNALIAFVKALKMKFEVSPIETPYNPEFVAKIEKSRKDYKAGKGTVMTMDELKNLCK
ncbi:MAG: hypothetical protein HYU67_09720 [Flavobacteriia bacterium]|nr:hypothetical protein [Flavobacteriia bacterium]